MKMVNAMLREPAREESAFRRKLDSIFRQVHSIKGEAAALGLGTDREPRPRVRGRAEGGAREDRAVGRRLPAAGGQARRPVHASRSRSATWSRASRSCNYGAGGDGEEPAAPRTAARAPPRPRRRRPDDPITQTLSQLTTIAARPAARRLGSSPGPRRRAACLPPGGQGHRGAGGAQRASCMASSRRVARRARASPSTARSSVDFRAGAGRLPAADQGRRRRAVEPSRIREAAVSRGILTGEDAAPLDSKQLLVAAVPARVLDARRSPTRMPAAASA